MCSNSTYCINVVFFNVTLLWVCLFFILIFSHSNDIENPNWDGCATGSWQLGTRGSACPTPSAAHSPSAWIKSSKEKRWNYPHSTFIYKAFFLDKKRREFSKIKKTWRNLSSQNTLTLNIKIIGIWLFNLYIKVGWNKQPLEIRSTSSKEGFEAKLRIWTLKNIERLYINWDF